MTTTRTKTTKGGPSNGADGGSTFRYVVRAPLNKLSTAEAKPETRYGAATLVTVLLILLPHPSFLPVLVHHHLHTLHAPVYFTLHLAVVYALTALALCSLTVCAVRDPGRVPSLAKADEDDGEARGCRCEQGPAPQPEPHDLDDERHEEDHEEAESAHPHPG